MQHIITRKSAIILLFVGGAAAVLLGGGYFLNISANQIVTIQAERSSTAWATYIGSQLQRIEEIAAGADLTPADQDFLAGARKFGDIFRFKLFDRKGSIRLISDDLHTELANNPDLAEDNWKALLVANTGRPYTQLQDGNDKEDRPDLYAETYVPVIRDGKLVAVVEVYIDETAEARAIKADFVEFGLKIGGVILFGFCLPGIALVSMLRRLREQNKEQKRVDKALRGSEERFRDLVEGSVQGVLIHDGSKTIFANQAYAEIFGHQNAGEILAQDSPFDHLMPHEQDRIKEYSKSRLVGDDVPTAYEFEGLRKDGLPVWLDNRVRVITWNGAPAVQRTVVDITKRKEAEKLHEMALLEAEQANRAKSDFLAMMSHELRTPLNAINGFAEMLMGEFFGAHSSPKYKEYATDIRSSSGHLLNLVGDILDLSVIEAGKIQLNKENFPIDEIVRECSRFIIKDVGLNGIRYAVDVSAGLPSLRADKRAVKQILINLLANSAKFTPDGGTISLSAKVSNGHHIIQIRDNGAGISEDMLVSLGDPFFRAQPNPHIAHEGYGLGLAIVKSLVKLHNGEVAIESEIGKGTIVSVKFPSNGVV
jgi:PAS domain S-box-containing protein